MCGALQIVRAHMEDARMQVALGGYSVFHSTTLQGGDFHWMEQGSS
jgi:hypothetical protein